MLNKKAQGLPLNVIIIAAIVLIVLVVLWSIFTGRMGMFTKGLTECKGRCIPLSKCQAKAPEGDCPPESEQKEGREWLSNQKTVCCLLER